MKIKQIDNYQCEEYKKFMKKLNDRIHFELGHCIEIDLKGVIWKRK